MNKKVILIFVVGVLFLVGFVVFFIKPQPLKVVNTFPKDNEKAVLTNSDIVIFFDQKISIQQRNSLSFDFDPKGEFKLTWGENGVTIADEKGLIPSRQYKVIVLQNNKEIYHFSFETIGLTPSQIQEEGNLQTLDDRIFGQAYEQFIKDSPWYLGLPIQTNKYFVVFDFETKSFRIRINNQFKNEEDVLIEEVLGKLEAIGVPKPIKYYTIGS